MSTQKLVELALSVPRDAFIAQVPARFLVLGAPANEQQPMSFSTQVFRAPNKEPAREELVVLPVAKAANNPYADRVSVGRARNCDMVVRDPSVSKLHAVVRIDGEAFSLVDIGSQNGTYLNGQRLAINEAAPISCNDEILIGNVSARFMDGGAVYTILVAAQGSKAVTSNAT
jgi:predicted component of type VI protein secretion system